VPKFALDMFAIRTEEPLAGPIRSPVGIWLWAAQDEGRRKQRGQRKSTPSHIAILSPSPIRQKQTLAQSKIFGKKTKRGNVKGASWKSSRRSELALLSHQISSYSVTMARSNRKHPHSLASVSIGLRIASTPPPRGDTASFEGAADALAILRGQETYYRCGGYFDRLERERDPSIGSCNPLVTFETIDAGCRERMCEWCYKVCDSAELPLTREMVAITFSYLDRFLDQQPFCCDRASFKLAVVTSFYVATKIMSSKQISISSLCTLGRGTFGFHQVQEMEKIILTSLDWRMNPPTAQAMVTSLRSLFPKTVSSTLTDAIFQRAIFFTEIAVYDPHFISMSRYVLAVASFINAMEYIEDNRGLYPREKESFASFIAVLCMDLDRKTVNAAKLRLWSLYESSAEGRQEEMIALEYDPPRSFPPQHKRRQEDKLPSPQSPRGVEILER